MKAATFLFSISLVLAASSGFSALLPSPTLFAPADAATSVSTKPAFTWSTVVGANRYWLTVSTNLADLPTEPNATICPGCVASGLTGNTGATNYTAPTAFPNGGTTRALTPNTTYYWKVQAWNTDGTQGNYSSARSFTTAPLLAAPMLLAPPDAATGVLTKPAFRWSAIAGANRYWLAVSTNLADLPTDPNATTCPGCVASGLTGNTGATNYTPATAFPNGGTTRALSPNTTYYWKVQAWNTDGTQGNYSSVRSFTTAPLLAAPTLFAPPGAATGVSINPTFTWSAIVGANRYWLMAATSPSAFPTDPNATSCPDCVISGNTGATNYTPPTAFPNGGATRTLSSGTIYYWKVQAWNTSGTQGAYSTAPTFTTGTPPVIDSPKLIGTTFTMAASTGARTDYVLEFKSTLTQANWTPIQTNVGTGAKVQFTNTGVAGPSRFYRLRIQ